MGKASTIDLNCDLAELEGQTDLQVMPYISSCNIACGGHAGSPKLMRLAIKLAMQHGVTIGAHPGYPDPENFGRVSMKMKGDDLANLFFEQVMLLQGFAEDLGNSVKYVKLHGALYHDAASDESTAIQMIKGLKKTGLDLPFLGPDDTVLQHLASQNGFGYFCESFIDRRYGSEGRLLPRSEEGSIISQPEEIDQQLSDIVILYQVKTNVNTHIPIAADSICLHGDHPGAAQNAKRVRVVLEQLGVTVKSFVK